MADGCVNSHDARLLRLYAYDLRETVARLWTEMSMTSQPHAGIVDDLLVLSNKISFTVNKPSDMSCQMHIV